MALKINSTAPDFTLPSTTGKDFKLSEDFKDTPCIIYFYPKDFTPGCTAEACDFRDNIAYFKDLGIDVVGISRDTIETHLKFQKAHELPFALLADIDGKVCKAYEAMIPLIGVPKRITYLLDKNHTIVEVFEQLFGSRAHIKAMIAKVKEVGE
ncbi:MAG: peroxiredoxin [Microscillaceae bacterium]|jgi:peroxiredoxin Q/BCP|nr:peroxiredoxin [Microscillaceae bacterium]